MQDPNLTYKDLEEMRKRHEKRMKNNYWLPPLTFVITFITALIAGTEWIRGYGQPFDVLELSSGLPYAVSILLMLGAHEFGHYFAAMYHKVKSSLPYFIPFPPIPGLINFGTLGAVIRTKVPIPSLKVLFDIGIAGPIAGFIVSVALLVYGFTHLPGQDYILAIHPDYFSPDYGKGALSLTFGDTPLFAALRWLLTSPGDFVPPMSEVYHYPYLCVGWFGLFVTAMNLIPVGQLDGGHVIYALFGREAHYRIASISMLVLIFMGVLGFVSVLIGIDLIVGWSGWLFWALMLYFVVKVKHPPVRDETPISPGRRILGYIAIIVFMLSFSPTPFMIDLGL